MHPLDNVVWAALAGPQEAFAERCGAARRFPADISPFAALPDEPTPASWLDLAALIGPARNGWLLRAKALDLPAGWQEIGRGDLVQMVAHRMTSGGSHAGASTHDIVQLGADDVPEMRVLVGRTNPGPFEARTIELGTYLGVRARGALVAMAGERMRVAGCTEVSAVCTDPDHRGRGHAERLVRAVAAGIVARGEVPFLHVLAANEGARRVYTSLGFEPRCEATALMAQTPGGPSEPGGAESRPSTGLDQ